MDKFIIAGKYGFLTTALLKERERYGHQLTEREARDVRDAHEFIDLAEAVAHRFDVTDGVVLKKV